MQPFSRFLLACLVLCLSRQASAAVLVYTDRGQYRQAMHVVASDNFSDLAAPALVEGSVQRLHGTYRASALDLAGYGPGQGADALYTLDGGGATWLSTNFASAALSFNGFGHAVHGIGGTFLVTDVDGAALAGALQFTLQDEFGLFEYQWNSSGSDGFIAFASNGALQALRVRALAGTQPLFATAAQLDIGIVPEPGMAALLPLAGLAMLLARRRQKSVSRLAKSAIAGCAATSDTVLLAT